MGIKAKMAIIMFCSILPVIDLLLVILKPSCGKDKKKLIIWCFLYDSLLFIAIHYHEKQLKMMSYNTKLEWLNTRLNG